MANHYDMTVPGSVKAGKISPQAVAVILSRADLARAARLRRLPAFFELRLDALSPWLDEGESTISRLRAPLIVTARHREEGGRNALSTAQRRALLLRFLPRAACVDVELRAMRELGAVLDRARVLRVRRIISVHHMRSTPPIEDLREQALASVAAGADVFKIATCTDTREELDRLVAFFDSTKGRMQISAMGVGKLGRLSRRLLARRGSVLNYAHLGAAATEGQLSLAELRCLR